MGLPDRCQSGPGNPSRRRRCAGALCIVHCMLHSIVHAPMCIVHCMLHLMLCMLHCALCTVYCVLHSIRANVVTRDRPIRWQSAVGSHFRWPKLREAFPHQLLMVAPHSWCPAFLSFWGHALGGGGLAVMDEAALDAAVSDGSAPRTRLPRPAAALLTGALLCCVRWSTPSGAGARSHDFCEQSRCEAASDRCLFFSSIRRWRVRGRDKKVTMVDANVRVCDCACVSCFAES